MIKKILLILSVIVFAVSCSNPSNPNNGNTDNGGNNGNGETPGGDTSITDPNKIAEFLKNHEGRYYNKNNYYNTHLRVENEKIYYGDSKTEAVYDKISLSGNDIRIETKDQITTYNFNNNIVNEYSQLVCQKEAFSKPQDLVAINTISAAAVYSGNYYILYDDGIRKEYYFAIGPDGQIYSQNRLKDFTFTLNGNKLTATGTDGINTIKNEYTIENDRLIINQYGYLNGELYPTNKLDKSDLLTPYIGTYTATGVTLTVTEADAVISSIAGTASVLNGKTLIVYESDGTTEHTIVFTDDKAKATYTKPDTSTVELIKQPS